MLAFEWFFELSICRALLARGGLCQFCAPRLVSSLLPAWSPRPGPGEASQEKEGRGLGLTPGL